MSGTSKIEWTDATWNPVTGCTKVSPGCDHCYAERLTERFHGKGSFAKVVLHPERMKVPYQWRKPRMVFVNSMSDLFHIDVPMGFLEKVWSVMEGNYQHTFQVLTKRAERMERVVPRLQSYEDGRMIGRNIWLGVSVETAAYYSRIRHLQRTPAAVRFLSCEPLLGPLPNLPLDGIGWVIVGGESGPGARPMHIEWAREIRDQCIRAGVPLFFKQWGEWQPIGPVYNDDLDDGDVVSEQVIWQEDSHHEVRWMTKDEGDTGTDSHYPLQPVSPDPWWIARVGKHADGHDVLDKRIWHEMPAATARGDSDGA